MNYRSNRVHNLINGFIEDIGCQKISSYQALYLSVITRAVTDYLYFLIRPGFENAESFIDAYEYLFIHRSKNIRGNLTKFKCFDIHFREAGLNNYLSLADFTDQLRKVRKDRVNSHKRLLLKNINQYRNTEWKTGKNNRLTYKTRNYTLILTEPKNIKELARLLLYKGGVVKKEKNTELSYKKRLI